MACPGFYHWGWDGLNRERQTLFFSTECQITVDRGHVVIALAKGARVVVVRVDPLQGPLWGSRGRSTRKLLNFSGLELSGNLEKR